MKKTILILSFFFPLTIGVYLGVCKGEFIIQKKQEIFKLISESLNFLNRPKIKKLEISIKNKDFKKFQTEINELSKNKWFNKEIANYYKCEIKIGDKVLRGKIRAKGLLLKPWENFEKKFSYKIKIKEDSIYNLKKFYLNYPKKRNNLHEWYGDQILSYFGLISQKNLFCNLIINKKDEGLYLFEESFDEKLLSNNNRPMGPIVSYNKNNLVKYGVNHYGESFFSSEVEPQYSNKYNNTVIKLLESFIEKKEKVSDIFEIEKTAEHLAISDLVGYYHQLNYHNVKFYYNPESKKIEPIANDFQFYDLSKWTNETYGITFNKQNYISSHLNYLDSPWMKTLFNDHFFFDLYVKKLEFFTKSNVIDSLFKYLDPKETQAKKIMSTFDPLYYPKVKNIIQKNTEQIRFIISKNFKVKAICLQTVLTDSIFLKIYNYNYLPIKVLGIYENKIKKGSCVKGSLILGKNYSESPKEQEVKFSLNKKIHNIDNIVISYQVVGDEKERRVLLFN